MQLRLEPLALRTRFAFRIAHGTKQEYRNTLVRLEHEGIEGLGEASPAHYYGETPTTVSAALEAWAPHLGDDPFALDAIGARLRLTVGTHTLTRWIAGGGSFLASHDRRVVFGLGGGGSAGQLEIRWPSGRIQRLGGLEPGLYHIIKEPL